MKFLNLLLAAGLVGLAACSAADSVNAPSAAAPTPATPAFSNGAEDPNFFHPAITGAVFANPVVSFWAVKGVDRAASIWYHKRPGARGRDSTEFVRFRVDKRSLLARPDGTTIANGDSVLITMTVVDTLNMIVEFQPSGLQFDPSRPAVLAFKLTEADHDVNGDGVINTLDQAVFQAARIRGQEDPTLPWFVVPTTVSLSADSYTANLTGFTRYAVSY